MKRTLLFAGLMTLLAIPSFAVVQIDFTNGTAGSGGTINTTGCVGAVAPFYQCNSGANANGTGVLIGSLTVIGAGAADGVYDTFGTGAGLNNGSAVLNFNTATNFIEIIGGICAAGNSTCNGGGGTLVTSTTLLQGTFITWGVVQAPLSGGLVGGAGPDAKSPLLLAALGIPSNATFDYFAFNIQGTRSTTSGSYTAISTDILNTSEIPEPASIVLFGTVLFGVTQLLRRRAAKV